MAVAKENRKEKAHFNKAFSFSHWSDDVISIYTLLKTP